MNVKQTAEMATALLNSQPPSWVVEMNTPLAKRSGKANSFRNPPGFTTKSSGKQVLHLNKIHESTSQGRGDAY